MTLQLGSDRLRDALRGADPQGAGGPVRLSVGAAAAGLVAAGVGLVACWVVALLGWYSADGGAHGTTRSALRLGSDVWLMAHGSHLETNGATITAVPLGLTFFLAYVAFCYGRHAGERCAGSDLPADVRPDLKALGLGAVVFAGVYAVIAVLVAVLASTPSAAPGLGRAFVGAAVVAALGGGLGLVVGADRLAGLLRLASRDVRAIAYGALLIVLAMFAAGALVVALALALHLDSAANLLVQLRAGVAGGAFSVLLVALAAPNLALLGASYLLGPGFAVGTATVVSPDQVILGPVPAVPVFAALPTSALGQPWAGLLWLVPVTIAGWAVWKQLQRFPTRRFDRGVARGAGAGAVAAVLLTAGFAVAGGAIGAGRMGDLGPMVSECLLVSLAAFAGGGAIMGAGVVWWRQRTVDEDDDLADEPEPDPETDESTVIVDLGGEPTVQIPLPRGGVKPDPGRRSSRR